MSSAERYVLKDFPGSSHRLLAAWLRDLPPAARVLDVGAGAALMARSAAAQGRSDLRWLALDGSLDCLGALRRYTQGAAIVDLEQMPQLPGQADAVIAGDLLEHLHQPERFARHMLRSLRPGGVALVSVPNVANVVMRVQLLFGRFEYRERGILDRTHRTFFTRRRLRQVLREAGFEIESESASTLPLHLVLPSWPDWLLSPMLWIMRGLTAMFPRLFGYQLLARAIRPAAAATRA